MATQRTQLESSANRSSNWFIHLLQGGAIGAANVVPGVSGGTLALILGIYQTLIDSLKEAGRRPFWSEVLRLRWGRAFQQVNGAFLLPLIIGAVIAIATLARGLEWLFTYQRVYLLSFFFGLILASILPVSRYVERWRGRVVLSFVVGTVAGFLIVGLPPISAPTAPWFLFVSGALAVCAFILPGISGAFILILLGNYEYVLAGVNRGDLFVIGILGLGAVIGLLSFAQLLSWLFSRFHDLTLALLAGFMLGSLRKVWPWQRMIDQSAPDLTQNYLPGLFTNGSFNLQLLVAIAAAFLGAVIVFFIERYAKKS